jgi:hypothetical protein
MKENMRTLLLTPPSYGGFDGSAGARYQARREIRSFWYPTSLAYPAGLIPESRLVDAPPAGMNREDVVRLARETLLHESGKNLQNPQTGERSI